MVVLAWFELNIIGALIRITPPAHIYIYFVYEYTYFLIGIQGIFRAGYGTEEPGFDKLKRKVNLDEVWERMKW